MTATASTSHTLHFLVTSSGQYGPLGEVCVANNGCSAKSSRTARRKSLLNHVKEGKAFGRGKDPSGFSRKGAVVNLGLGLRKQFCASRNAEFSQAAAAH